MSHKCALKLTDLWKTILLFNLNCKFELIGASLLALAKSAVYKSGTGTRGRGRGDACVGTWD